MMKFWTKNIFWKILVQHMNCIVEVNFSYVYLLNVTYGACWKYFSKACERDFVTKKLIFWRLTDKSKKASTSIFLANRCFIKTKYNMYIHDRTGKRSTYQPRPFFLSKIFINRWLGGTKFKFRSLLLVPKSD